MVSIKIPVLIILSLATTAEASGGEVASHSHHTADHNNQHTEHTEEQECHSSTESWYDTHLDFFHLENWILAFIVVFAVAFELAWHTITHWLRSTGQVEHSWIAMIREQQLHRTIEEAAKEFNRLSKSLWMTLVERTAGELMVLGFLALVLWAMVRLDFFLWIACSLRSTAVTLPHSHEEYVEMVEDVHMHLFLTMVAFIVTIGVAIPFVERQLSQWTQDNDAVCKATAEAILKYANAENLGTETLEEEGVLAVTPPGVKTEDFFYFARSRRLLFERINRGMRKALASDSNAGNAAEWNIVHEVLEEITNELNKQAGRPKMCFKNQLSETMDEWFPFQEYVKLECHLLLEDVMEIKALTWLYLAAGLVVSAILLRETGDLYWLWIVKGVQLLIALVMGLAVPFYMKSFKQEKTVSISTASLGQMISNAESISAAVEVGRDRLRTAQREARAEQPEGTHRPPEGARPEGAHAGGAEGAAIEDAEEGAEEEEDGILHELGCCLGLQDFPMFGTQMFLFYGCFGCVRIIAGMYWWLDHLPYAITALLILLLGIPLAGYLVSKMVILLAVMLARGDMKVKKAHLDWIFIFAEQYLHQLRRHEFRGVKDLNSASAESI